MNKFPEGLGEELTKIWTALMADLHVAQVRFVLQRGLIHAFLQDDALVVPESYSTHFDRFGTIPTSLVRDAAYVAKKRQLQSKGKKASSVEADAMAYAEVFLRAAVSQAEDD